jgi:hypothetical protein
MTGNNPETKSAQPIEDADLDQATGGASAGGTADIPSEDEDALRAGLRGGMATPASGDEDSSGDRRGVPPQF